LILFWLGALQVANAQTVPISMMSGATLISSNMSNIDHNALLANAHVGRLAVSKARSHGWSRPGWCASSGRAQFT